MIALSEIRGLSLQEKLRTMEVLWEDISPQEAGLEVPLWHKDLLDERERLVAEGKPASSTGRKPNNRFGIRFRENRDPGSGPAGWIEGYHFYEAREPGLGGYFLDTLFAGIDSLRQHGGIHRKVHRHFRRALSKRFPFAIYYSFDGEVVQVRAAIDCRRNPSWIKKHLSGA